MYSCMYVGRCCRWALPDYIARSALWYAPVYNLLPERIVQTTCVKQFRCLLQRLLIDRAAACRSARIRCDIVSDPASSSDATH